MSSRPPFNDTLQFSFDSGSLAIVVRSDSDRREKPQKKFDRATIHYTDNDSNNQYPYSGKRCYGNEYSRPAFTFNPLCNRPPLVIRFRVIEFHSQWFVTERTADANY